MYSDLEKIWSLNADVFIPCAASRLVTKENLNSMISSGVELISSGANVPFSDPELFYGPIAELADKKISLIPDFISNCGMARVFAYLMEQRRINLDDKEIFEDCSNTIKFALQSCYAVNKSKTNITETALEISLKKLLTKKNKKS